MDTRCRSFFGRYMLPFMTATLALGCVATAHASVFTVTIAQVGPDVVATGSGTIDLTGLTSFGSFPASPELYPAHGIIGLGPSTTVDTYDGSSGPGSFGPGFGGFPSTTSGDSVFLEDFGLGIDVPQGYVSGASLSDSATYVGTITSLNMTPGTYTWTWNSGANSFVLVIPTPTVPEPATWTLMLLGFAGLGAALRSRRKGATTPH